jgi:chitinase
MTPQSPKPSAHAVMTNQWVPTAGDLSKNRKPGFGTVINIINGGLECGEGRGSDKDIKAQNRIDAYRRILAIMNAPTEDSGKYPLDCKNSKDFTK